MGLVHSIDRHFYPQFEQNWDDVLFRERLATFIHPEAAVLDLGAGAGMVEPANFRDFAAWVGGDDLDLWVTENPYLDEGLVADNVMEQIDEFDQVFAGFGGFCGPAGNYCSRPRTGRITCTSSYA